MNQEQFIQKRDKWLTEVNDQCHQYALQTNIDYYIFQTPCEMYSPDLLIIGINPGGGKTHSEILKNMNVEKRPIESLAYSINTLVVKPDWEKGVGNDKMRSSFKRVFNEETGLQEVLNNCVMMNLFYFNTVEAKEIDNIEKEIKEFCLKKTIEFIEILNPKTILFLTSDDKNLKPAGVTKKEALGNNVILGGFNDRNVLIIPHYVYSGAYSSVKGPLMGKTLKKSLTIYTY